MFMEACIMVSRDPEGTAIHACILKGPPVYRIPIEWR